MIQMVESNKVLTKMVYHIKNEKKNNKLLIKKVSDFIYVKIKVAPNKLIYINWYIKLKAKLQCFLVIIECWSIEKSSKV